MVAILKGLQKYVGQSMKAEPNKKQKTHESDPQDRLQATTPNKQAISQEQIQQFA